MQPRRLAYVNVVPIMRLFSISSEIQLGIHVFRNFFVSLHAINALWLDARRMGVEAQLKACIALQMVSHNLENGRILENSGRPLIFSCRCVDEKSFITLYLTVIDSVSRMVLFGVLNILRV